MTYRPRLDHIGTCIKALAADIIRQAADHIIGMVFHLVGHGLNATQTSKFPDFNDLVLTKGKDLILHDGKFGDGCSVSKQGGYGLGADIWIPYTADHGQAE